jgi:competence CoiA-like predicted nuclease
VNLDHIKMTRAYDVNNVIVDVKAVKRGKSFDCHCIVCDTPLIARQGEKNISTFAHDPAYGEVTCAWSGETELHLRVKEYLSNVPNLLVPIGINNPTIELLRIDNVLLEMR